MGSRQDQVLSRVHFFDDTKRYIDSVGWLTGADKEKSSAGMRSACTAGSPNTARPADPARRVHLLGSL